MRYSTPTIPPPSNPSQPQQQTHTQHSQPQQNIMNPEAVVALAPTGPPPPNIPTNHTGPPSAPHVIGHPQVGIPPQIQVHYPTIFHQATLMPQQNHHQTNEQLEQQVMVPDQQQIHQQVYHYQQEIQVQPKTQESLISEDKKAMRPPTIAQTAVSCFRL